ncbi:hypothetical protein COO60DRAFT_1654489 [Scenedesmus sp. NREL 46B-D3]|nr:hypothetical protein COO60DRAFT_1654489 [Scenedesmus sp. NREL 46B-D3]
MTTKCITCRLGGLSYVLLTFLATSLLHSEQAVATWRAEERQVPVLVYDRSMFMFGTAFVIDVLSACFELKTSRLDMVLLPAFVKGVATLTNILRYICWMHTTPTILLLVKMISTTISRKQLTEAIVCVELMLVTGAAGAMTTGSLSGCIGVRSPGRCNSTLVQHSQSSAVLRARMQFMWSAFGVIWDLRMFGLVGLKVEEVANICCDFSAKVVFSCGLMLSSFKGMDCRREGVMRQIQESHRQTLIQELKRVIEQKDAFMSSVSHELRTPLNGIIGVSEGLLSGCCGILNESVRRQIYIVRTSGARLLALINDVMDAAALRQHRLVLKQERLELRQVVGDVSDLTRSLVDNDVSLRNEVPEAMLVWADSGRIIQVLNNLLGNAAKFTRQGFIRVSASWHDSQHQWVAVHVTDTGIGIPKQKLASIFLPFEQVDGSISRQYGGFGLGLSITQELVKAHGGELWVRSREGKGSSFSFTLPSYTGQSKAAAAAVRVQATASITPGTAESAAPGLPRRGSRSALLEGGARSRRGSVLLPPPDGLAGGADGSGRLRPPQQLEGAGSLGLIGEFGDALLGDEYARELPYDAAQLSALASSKPFAAPANSASGSQQHRHKLQHSSRLRRSSSSASAMSGSNLRCGGGSGGDAGGLAAGQPVLLDPRPTQFARTGRHQVLSVDDDILNQTVVQSLLSSTGYEVVCLPSGVATLEYIDSAEVLPDLILLDVMMPDMSGPEVCAQLAAREPQLAVPIILVSAHSEEAMVVRGLDAGAVDYITKPFKRAEFLARIRAKLSLCSDSQGGAQQEQVQLVLDEQDAAEPLVMCVDDDEVNHIVLEGMLQSQSYSCRRSCLSAHTAAGGQLHAHRTQQLRSSALRHLVLVDAALTLRTIVPAAACPHTPHTELLPHLFRYAKARSGSQALSLLDSAGGGLPHLVLLDTALPDTTGLDVLQQIRARFNQVVLPVVMLTARHNEKAIVEALNNGANDYAVKPFRRSELLARIRMHLRSSQKAAATAAAVAPMSPVAAALAAADEGASMELQQLLPAAEQLQQVPLLVAQLDGLEVAAAGLAPEQLSQLLGAIADTFDAVVEKYAVLKLRIAVHVGALHAGVYVKQACAVAPPSTVVATAAAASQLRALGWAGLQPLSVPWPEPSAGAAAGGGQGSSSSQQLWTVAAQGVGSCTPTSTLGACWPNGAALFSNVWGSDAHENGRCARTAGAAAPAAAGPSSGSSSASSAPLLDLRGPPVVSA